MLVTYHGSSNALLELKVNKLTNGTTILRARISHKAVKATHVKKTIATCPLSTDVRPTASENQTIRTVGGPILPKMIANGLNGLHNIVPISARTAPHKDIPIIRKTT